MKKQPLFYDPNAKPSLPPELLGPRLVLLLALSAVIWYSIGCFIDGLGH